MRVGPLGSVLRAVLAAQRWLLVQGGGSQWNRACVFCVRLRRSCLPCPALRRLRSLQTAECCPPPLQRARANDPTLHTDKTMFSCGSLAPKLQRGGGCVDHGFARWVGGWGGAGLAEQSCLCCLDTQGRCLLRALFPLLWCLLWPSACPAFPPPAALLASPTF